VHPDAFLLELHGRAPEAVEACVRAVHAEAERLSGDALDLRALLKRARLPRLAKALTRRAGPKWSPRRKEVRLYRLK
jgi:hypothetical protein